MRVPIQLYDSKRIPFNEGDLIRVHHFVDRRGRNHYMYKKVTKRDGFWYALHYPFNDPDSGYDMQCQCDISGVCKKDTRIIDEDLTNHRGGRYWYEREKLK